MNYPFSNIPSAKLRRSLSLVLVTSMAVAALSGCSALTKSTEPTEEDPAIDLPSLVQTESTEPAATEATVPEETEPEKDNVAIVKEQLSVRSKPSTGSNIVSQLDAGEKVEVLRSEQVNGAQWAYVYSETTAVKGWVSQEMLDMSNVTGEIASSTTPAQNGETILNSGPTTAPGNTGTSVTGTTMGVVTASQLNIRSEADSSSTKVGSLNYGDRVTVTETNGSWGKIKQGWISLDYVYVDGRNGKNPCTGTVNATELSVRSGPGTTYDKVSSLSNGSTVEVLEQIKVGNSVWGCIKGGWICMDYVSVNGTTGGTISGTTPNTNANTNTNTNTGNGIGIATVTGNGLNIRTGAGTGYPVAGGLAKGQQVTVYEKTVVDGATWGRIEGGWICLDYTNFN